MKTNLTFQGEFLAIRNISEKVYLKKGIFVQKVYLKKEYVCKKGIFVKKVYL